MNEEKNLEVAKRFEKLIREKGFSPYGLSMSLRYGTSRVYRLTSGKDDIKGLSINTLIRLCKLLGFATIEDFYKEIGIDLFKEIN